MRTVQEWRDEMRRRPDMESQMRSAKLGQPRFREVLDGWIADGHANDWVKVTVIDSGETGFELLPRTLHRPGDQG